MHFHIKINYIDYSIKNNKISIIIPTFNREKIIEHSIKTVLNQTYNNIEIIVIDDCSTDDTESVINEIKDNRIRYIKLKKKKGANYARNLGINMASGKYISFLDSDDIFYNNKLIKQINNIENNKSDLDFCKIRININNKNRFSFIIPNDKQELSIFKGNIFEELTKGNFISTQSILTKRTIIKKFLFDTNIPRLQDYDFLLRIIPKVKVSFTKEILGEINIQKDSISSSLIKLQEAIKIILILHY